MSGLCSAHRGHDDDCSICAKSTPEMIITALKVELERANLETARLRAEPLRQQADALLRDLCAARGDLEETVQLQEKTRRLNMDQAAELERLRSLLISSVPVLPAPGDPDEGDSVTKPTLERLRRLASATLARKAAEEAARAQTGITSADDDAQMAWVLAVADEDAVIAECRAADVASAKETPSPLHAPDRRRGPRPRRPREGDAMSDIEKLRALPLQQMLECARSWEPDVCLIGNVRARDLEAVFVAVPELLTELERLRRLEAAVKERIDDGHGHEQCCATKFLSSLACNCLAQHLDAEGAIIAAAKDVKP